VARLNNLPQNSNDVVYFMQMTRLKTTNKDASTAKPVYEGANKLALRALAVLVAVRDIEMPLGIKTPSGIETSLGIDVTPYRRVAFINTLAMEPR
jgi:hypothetical protein